MLVFLWPSGVFYRHWKKCGLLVYFMVIRYTFSRFGLFIPKKSGNPELRT
jgi:hypothetical protein